MMPHLLNAQVRAGASFLKFLPGIRNQGMASSQTGVIDEIHGLYANPGATGLMREWQVSASYTNWIADVQSLSWLYGQQLRTPWSNHTRFALGIHYQDVGDFNSTRDRNAATASASDALFTLSLGQRLGGISRNLSFGANLKYFRSDLDGISASSFIADLGLLYRTEQMPISFLGFEYAILSAGASLNQLGQPMDFIGVESPLPRAFRTGAALNIGSHESLQIQLAADYSRVLDETDRFSIGAEAMWGYRFGIRAGYTFNENLFSKFTVGASLRLGIPLPFKARANDSRIDVAYRESIDVFSDDPLRFGLNNYPIGPEQFWVDDTSHQKPYSPEESVALHWEETRDPDVYDTVDYIVFLVKGDRTALASMMAKCRYDGKFLDGKIDAAETSGEIHYRFQGDTLQWASEANSQGSFIWSKDLSKLPDTYIMQHAVVPTPLHEAGDYYWTSLAYDRDNHVRFADNIGHFRIAKPDLIIPVIAFESGTEDDCTNDDCKIVVTVKNNGEVPAGRFALNLYEDNIEPVASATAPQPTSRLITQSGDSALTSDETFLVDSLQPDSTIKLELDWTGQISDSKFLFAIADVKSAVNEEVETNNSKSTKLGLPDLVLTLRTSPENAAPGDSIDFIVRVENRGSAPASNFQVLSTISEDLELNTGDAYTQDRRFSMAINLLAPNTHVEDTLRGRVNPSWDLSDIENKGMILAPFCDLNPADNCYPNLVPPGRYNLALDQTTDIIPFDPKVRFEHDSSRLELLSQHTLTLLSKALNQPELENFSVYLGGHTDETGAASYNKALSKKRVDSVKDYMSQKTAAPVDKNRIKAEGWGLEQPLQPNTGKNLFNRRVEFFLVTGLAELQFEPDKPHRPKEEFRVKALFETETIKDTLIVTNVGDVAAKEVVLTNSLPPFAKIKDKKITYAIGSAQADSTKINWNPLTLVFKELEAGAKIELYYEIHFPHTLDRYPGVFTSRPEVSAAKPGMEQDLKNNFAEGETIYILAHPDRHEMPANLYKADSDKEIYIVKSGDSLSGIAMEKYEGNWKRWKDIYDANRNVITGSPNLILPGWELVLPAP